MYYNMNRNVLEKYNSYLALQLSTRGITSGYGDVVTGVESCISRDGFLVIRVLADGKWRYLNSAYSFKSEVKRFMDGIPAPNDYAVVVILGFANGVLIREIINNYPEHVKYIMYEPSIAIFDEAMHGNDLTDILNNKRVHIFVKGINDSCIESYIREVIDETNYRISTIMSLPYYRNIFYDDYSMLLNYYNSARSNLASDQYSGQVHNRIEAENAIRNLRYLFFCNCEEQYRDCFPVDVPAVIISAGPSLEKNGHLLKNIKNKLLIMAVDTALPYLLSIDVIPDLLITASPNKDQVLKQLYDDPCLSNIAFAIDTAVTWTGIDKANPEKLILISSASGYYNKMLQLGGHHIHYIDNGGSVSTVALGLAKLWGYKKFVMVGLDLALEDNKLYSGTPSDDYEIPEATVEIDGYYGDKVYTLQTYKMHLDWFEMFIRTNPDCSMYNATEGGALIHGAENITLQEIADRYSGIECDYREMIWNMEPAIPKERIPDLFTSIKQSIDNLLMISDWLIQGEGWIKRNIQLLNNGAKRTDPLVVGNHREIDRIIELCTNMEECYFVERFIGQKQGDVLEDIYVSKDNPNDEYLRILYKIYSYFEDMSNAVMDVKEIFGEMIGELEYGYNEYYNNLMALKAWNLELYEKLNEYNNKDCVDIVAGNGRTVDCEMSRSGHKIIKVIHEGKDQWLNSRYDPCIEAIKYAAKYDYIPDFSVVVIFGLGNGMMVSEIVKKLGEHVSILVYEPSPEVFNCTIQHCDISELLSNIRLKIFVKDLNDEKFDVELATIVNESNYKCTFYITLPKYAVLFPEVCEYIRWRKECVVQGVGNNIATMIHQNDIVVRNNIYNLSFLDNCNCEEELRDKFPVNLPVVLVASGPSLEKNVDKLARLKGKLMIIAVDTALQFLISKGVRPDVTVVVDPHTRVDIFDGIDKEKLIFALGTGANHDALKSTGDARKIFISSDNAYYDEIFSLKGHHMYSLNNGGSVATVAFALAQSWGYSTFVLVGQDLAVSGVKRYAGRESNLGCNMDERIEIEGYYGGKAETTPDLKVYLDWYEMMARSYPEFTIINSTEGGAKIHGTIEKRLDDIVNEYAAVSYDYEKAIMECMPVFGADYDLARAYVKDSEDRLQSMKEKLVKGIDLIKNANDELSLGKYNLVRLGEINNRINAIMNECDDMAEGYFVDNIIADKQADVLADIYEEVSDHREEYRRILIKLKEYVSDMIDSIDEVKAMFEKVIRDM